MRLLIVLLTGAGLMFGLRPILATAQNGSTSPIVTAARAVLAEIRGEVPTSGPVKVDTRVLATPALAAELRRPWAAERDPAQTALLAAGLNASLGLREAVFVCSGPDPATCSLREADVHLAMSEPTVTADVAVVHVNALYHGGSARQPVVQRDYAVYLQRSGAAWRVERVVVTRTS